MLEQEIGKMFYNKNIEEARFRFFKGFNEWHNVVKLDVIQDLVYELENEYKRIRKLEYRKNNA
tara:strand:- start:14 stop:202 length:189 start_codon:yes stop_codon:yes gene_type:complete